MRICPPFVPLLFPLLFPLLSHAGLVCEITDKIYPVDEIHQVTWPEGIAEDWVEDPVSIPIGTPQYTFQVDYCVDFLNNHPTDTIEFWGHSVLSVESLQSGGTGTPAAPYVTSESLSGRSKSMLVTVDTSALEEGSYFVGSRYQVGMRGPDWVDGSFSVKGRKLNVTAVPEPGALMLILSAGLAWVVLHTIGRRLGA